MTEQLYSVQDLAELTGTLAPQINAWRKAWKSFPAPSYTNRRGLTPLWDAYAAQEVVNQVTTYLSFKQQ